MLRLDLITFLVENCYKVVDYGKHASALLTYEELWIKKNDSATRSVQHVTEGSTAPFREFAQYCLVRTLLPDQHR